MKGISGAVVQKQCSIKPLRALSPQVPVPPVVSPLVSVLVLFPLTQKDLEDYDTKKNVPGNGKAE